jgi:zinc protease
VAFEIVERNEKAEELRLECNGLRVLLVPEAAVPVAAACIVYRVGSRNEAVGYTGSTHLLEHLLFKGSERFDPRAGRPIARALERVGAAFNATTWFDRTSYYETVPPEHLDLALELEADRMRHALLREEDLASELTVVRNEFERGENDPFDVLLKESFAIAFREHPYHHPTIGWGDDIDNASIARLREFYDTFYYPDNACLVLAGSFDREAALESIERQFGRLARAPRPVPAVRITEPAQQGERRFVVRRAGEVGWVAVSWRAPAAGHADTHALAVLGDALASGVTSRLVQRLVEDGRCLDVHTVPWQLRDPGLFQVFACLNRGTSHEAVEEAIRDEVRRVAEHGLGADELERARVQVEAQTVYLRDSPGQVAAALTEAISCADWHFYFDYPARIEAVSDADVQRVAGAYLIDDAVSVGYFVPRDGSGAAPTPARTGPRPCHLRPSVAANVDSAALPGGVRVFVLPRRQNPTVTLHGSLLAGHGMVESANWTAASLVPEMLERGTRDHDRMSLARAIEDHGIELDVTTDAFNPFEVHVGGRSLTRHLPLLLDLLVEQLRHPVFPSEELEKLRQLRLGELHQAQEDTFTRAFEALTRLLYPPESGFFRRPFEERRNDLEALSREAVDAVHARLYGPASLVLALVGDCEPGAVLDLLAERIAGWTGGIESPPDVPRLRGADAVPAEARVDMADKPSLDVVLGHPGGLRRRDEDFLATVLGNAVLGQSTLTSRLGRRLRDAEGLTYGVVSRFMGASLADGPWITSFTVAPADLDRAVAAAREEIVRLLADGPSDDELHDEREAMAGSYRVRLATSSGLARELARLARHDLPVEEVERLPERVLSIPNADVVTALRRHIAPDRLSLAAAGQFSR